MCRCLHTRCTIQTLAHPADIALLTAYAVSYLLLRARKSLCTQDVICVKPENNNPRGMTQPIRTSHYSDTFTI